MPLSTVKRVVDIREAEGKLAALLELSMPIKNMVHIGNTHTGTITEALSSNCPCAARSGNSRSLQYN